MFAGTVELGDNGQQSAGVNAVMTTTPPPLSQLWSLMTMVNRVLE